MAALTVGIADKLPSKSSGHYQILKDYEKSATVTDRKMTCPVRPVVQAVKLAATGGNLASYSLPPI